MEIQFYVRDMPLDQAKNKVLEKIAATEKVFDCECELLEVKPIMKHYHRDLEDYSAHDIVNGLQDWNSSHDFKVRAYFCEK